MARTLDLAVNEFSVSKWPAIVGAKVLGGEEGALVIGNQDPPTVDGKGFHLPRGHIADSGDAYKFSHLFVLILVWPRFDAIGACFDDFEGEQGAFDSRGAEWNAQHIQDELLVEFLDVFQRFPDQFIGQHRC